MTGERFRPYSTRMNKLVASLVGCATSSIALCALVLPGVASAADVAIAVEPAMAAKVFAALADRGAKRVTGSPKAGLSVSCRSARACAVVLTPEYGATQFHMNPNGPFYAPSGRLFRLSPALSLKLYRSMSHFDGRPVGAGAERWAGSMYAGASMSCTANAVDVLKATKASCTLQVFPRTR